MTTLSKYLIALTLILIGEHLSAQTFSAKVIDQETNEPIPFASAQYGEYSGAITNEEGVFNFTLKTKAAVTDSLHLSSMGYDEKSFSLQTKLDSIIYLAPKAFELNSVYLSNNPLDPEEIIEKIKENMDANHKKNLTKKKIFIRHSDLSKTKKADFGFQKSTIAELDKHLIDSIAGLLPKQSAHYFEASGDLYGDDSKHKLHIDKAAELYDKKKDLSMEGLSEKMERIFKENVKPDSYLKIKSGFFSTKVELDSLKAAHQEESDAIVKAGEDNDHSFSRYMKDCISEMYSELFYNENSKIDIITKSNRYEFTQDDYTYIDDSPVYIMTFKPKAKKDFKGRMYVNMEDFAIMRLEFENVRPLKTFGLLGISYQHNLFKGHMLFQKNAEGSYSPKYLEMDSGKLFGLDRPLKVIEKNKHVNGKRKQNELSLKLDLELSQRNKYELVIFDSETINDSAYESALDNKEIEATYLSKYDPDFWQSNNIIEPNAAIQAFKVID